MIRTVSAALTVLAALTACAPTLSAQDSPTPSVDSLVAKLAELKRQRAALDKSEAEVRGQLKAELKRIADLVGKLDVDAPHVVPPDVRPKPPEPAADPLRDRVRDAIRASAGTDAEKRKQCLDLAALYRAAAKMAPDAEQFPDADALLTRLRQAAANLVGADALREVRRVVAGELAAVLPTVADAPLTDAHRAAAVKVFERLAAILESEGK